MITGVLGHSDEKGMETCDDKAMEHHDRRGHGVLL